MRGHGKKPPSYRKHKRSGQAVVTLNGQDFYLGTHGSKASKAEYDRLIGEWLTNGHTRLDVELGQITISELCSAYWKFAQGYYVKNGKKTDELAGLKTAIKTLSQAYASTPAKDFGPLSLEAVRNRFINAGHCRNYVNQNVGRIKRMFRWGVSRELVGVEVHQALSTVAGLRKNKSKAHESAPVLPVSDEVVNQTLMHVVSSVAADMIRFQRLTGCRPGELFVLRPCDVDRTGDGHDGVWLYYPESHKMEHKERSRVIVVGPRAQEILAPYLLREDKQCCFLRRNKKPFNRTTYWQHVTRACLKAFPAPDGLPESEVAEWQKSNRWAPNRLRHTASTEIRKEHGLEGAQVVAGHAQANVTQIYAERDLAKAAKIMREVG